MRFHVLGVSFAPTNRDYSCEGFSQKVRLFCKMMIDLGHTVYHYGVEGSNPICTENIDVVSIETYNRVHKSYDYKTNGFSYMSDTDAQDEFNYNSIIQIGRRKQPNDFLCFSFGFPQRPIYDAHMDLIPSEIGVGFDGSFSSNRVFESYAWMHTIYGKEGNLQNPNMYDAVIPGYYDLNDYIYSDEKDDYFFFIARMGVPSKGLEIALKSVESVGGKLITAGVGTPHITSPNMTHVGVVDFEQRAKLMSRAKATFVTTTYIEPYGSTVVESLLCGTPVISTDFGAFTENVIHGRVGYRCRTLEQFIWATKNINNIKPIDCRNYAVENFEISHIGKMYEEYFNALYISKTNNEGWYWKNPSRKNLNHLYKYIPNIKLPEEDKRPILCFFIGYDTDENVKNDKELIKITEELYKKYRVLVFGEINDIIKNNIEYYNFKRFEEFQNNNNIDTIIIYKYINFFLYFETKNSKLLFLSNGINPYYKGREIPNNGRGLLKNMLHKIDYIITLTESEKINFASFYNINLNKIYIIDEFIQNKMKI